MRKIVFIFLLAVLMRAAFILIWYQTGQGERLSSDAGYYHEMANNLMQGKGLRFEGKLSARRPPIYPFFISLLLKWSPFPLGIQAVQALIGAASCLILFGLGREMFGEKVGFLSAGILGIDYISVRQTVVILPETLFVFLILASFYCLFQARGEKGKKWPILAGCSMGLALLTRDVLIFYFPLAAIWLAFSKEHWSVRFSRAAAFLASVLLVIVPWILRNSFLMGRPVMITVGEAYTFYLANNPHASGGTTGADWEIGPDTYLPQNKPLPSQNTSTLQGESYLYKQSFDFIRNQPDKFVRLIGRKIVNMWRPYQTDSPRYAQIAAASTYIPVLILGLAGIVWSRNRWHEFFPVFALIGYIFLLHAILIAHIRYRYPVMPFFMVFAAYASWRLVSRKKTQLCASF